MPRLTPCTRDARRRQILSAAQRCFTRNGFQATTMAEVQSVLLLAILAIW